jgi:hypothetical protein
VVHINPIARSHVTCHPLIWLFCGFVVLNCRCSLSAFPCFVFEVKTLSTKFSLFRRIEEVLILHQAAHLLPFGPRYKGSNNFVRPFYISYLY